MKLVPVNLMPAVVLLLRVVGFVPWRARAALWPAGYFLLMTTSSLLCVVTQLLFTCHNLDHLDTVLKGVPIVSIMVGTSTTLVVFVCKRRSICRIVDEFQAEYDQYLSSSPVAVRRLKSFHVLILSLSCLILLALSIWVLQPLVTASGKLVLDAWFPFDAETPEVHALVNVHQSVAGAATALLALGATMLFCELVQHCCAHLEYVSVVLASALSGQRSPEYDLVLAQECPGAKDRILPLLVWSVKRHTTILGRVKTINTIFAFLAILDCFIALIVTGIIATEIFSETALSQLSKNLSLFVCSLIFFFLPCLSTRHLRESQLLIAQAIYDHNRISAGDEVNTFLSIICMKANSPSAVTFGGFGTMDLSTYTEALRMSYALFTMVYQFKSSSLTN